MNSALALHPTPADAIERARQHIPELPQAPHEGRWFPTHKEAVVRAIFKDLLTIEAAVSAYALSEDELGSWMVRYRKHGVRGLAVTKIQAVEPERMFGKGGRRG